MAQFAVHQVRYSDLVQAQRYGMRTFLNGVYTLPEFPDGRHEGSISIRRVTAASLSNVTDGTMTTNAAANTHFAMTFANKQFTASLLPSEIKQYGPREQAAEMQNVMSAQIGAIEGALLTAYMAATPTITRALPTGQWDFSSDRTDAEIRQNLEIIDQVWSDVGAKSGGDFENMFIVLGPKGYGYLSTYADIAGAPARVGADNIIRWRGQTPVYVSRATATGWQAEGGTAAIVGHRDSAAVAYGEPYLHGGGPIAASDGTTKYIWIVPYATGIIQTSSDGLWGEITNTSS